MTEKTTANNKNTQLERATFLGSVGFNVFPLIRDTKYPAIKEWQNKATTDPAQISEWFGHGGQLNIGICTSHYKGQHLVVLDVDNKGGKTGSATLDELIASNEPLPPTMRVTTPNGGEHYYFTSPDEFKNGVEVLGSGIDIRADRGFVVAMSSSIGGIQYRGKLVTVAPLPNWLAVLIRENQKQSNIIRLTDFTEDNEASIEKSLEYLTHNAPIAVEGEGGDNQTFIVAAMLADFGLSPQKSFDLMWRHWNNRCDPPWDQNELKQKIQNVAKFKQNSTGAKTGSADFSGDLAIPDDIAEQMMTKPATAPQKPIGNIYSVSEGLKRPPPVQIIKNIFPEKGVAILAGQSRHMKTFLAIDLVLSIVYGKNVGDLPVKQRPALYTLNEGENSFSHRAKAWMNYNDLADSPDFMIMDGTPSLMDAIGTKAFIDAVTQANLKPKVIVIDTFSKSTIGGDDNSTKDMTLAIENAYGIARYFDGLVILIDHLGKDIKKGLRGAYAKFAGADMVGVVEKTGDTVRLYTDKMKDGEDGLDFLFDVKMQHVEGIPEKMPVLARRTLDTRPTQKEWFTSYLVLNGEGVRSEMQKEFCKTYECDGSAFRSILSRLVKSGEIMIDDECVKLAEQPDFS